MIQEGEKITAPQQPREQGTYLLLSSYTFEKSTWPLLEGRK